MALMSYSNMLWSTSQGKKDLIRNLIIINDEAHHAWRTKSGEKVSVSLEELEEVYYVD